MTARTEKKDRKPWTPVDWDLADASALQAMQRGDADADQQRRALVWIVEKAAGVYDQSYYPGGEEGRRNTDFAEGRRFVGNTIVKLLRINVSAMRRGE